MLYSQYLKRIITFIVILSLQIGMTSASVFAEENSKNFSDFFSSEVLVTLNDDVDDVSIAEEIASKYGYNFSGIYEWNEIGIKSVVFDTLEPEGPIEAIKNLSAEIEVKTCDYMPKILRHLLRVDFDDQIKDEEAAKEIIQAHNCKLVYITPDFKPIHGNVKLPKGADFWAVRFDLWKDPNITFVGLCADQNPNAYAYDDPYADEKEIEETDIDDEIDVNKTVDTSISTDSKKVFSETRLYGSSRYYTAKAIAQEGWESESCSTVIVATGTSFPDALSGSGLAGIYDCPIILTDSSTLSPAANDLLTYLDPTDVIILGSTGAVSTAVENSIKAIVGSTHVSRLQGSNRYETCMAIYNAGVGNWSHTAILATGVTAPDALSASAYSFATKSPIFLVRYGNTLQTGMNTAISSGAITKAVILGAPEVIDTSLENQLKSQLGSENVIRIYGSDRYQTSSAFSEWASGNSTGFSVQPDEALTYDFPAAANGGNDHFADALAAGPLCGHNNSVLLLTQNNTTTSNYTVQNNIIPHKDEISNGYVIGASEVLSVDFLNHLNTVTSS